MPHISTFYCAIFLGIWVLVPRSEAMNVFVLEQESVQDKDPAAEVVREAIEDT